MKCVFDQVMNTGRYTVHRCSVIARMNVHQEPGVKAESYFNQQRGESRDVYEKLQRVATTDT